MPESFFKQCTEFGFDYIWLMGVWPSGVQAKAVALKSAHDAGYETALPGWRPGDVTGSPFAVSGYTLSDALGGEEGLQDFRRMLNGFGMKLMLDFVPNHVGVDHPWVTERPDLFVEAPAEVPGAFKKNTLAGEKWLAHGKDPYFPAWADTVQLDYRREVTRRTMREVLVSIAARCDGVRCDMAMLLLRDIFEKNWAGFGGMVDLGAAQEEFWTEAIAEVKRRYPGFLFLAEAYWNLEPKLQELGFDFTYDKLLYDRLVDRDGIGACEHLYGQKPGVLARSAHFLENHDEGRIASLVNLEAHEVYALLILGLPGLCLLNDGQLTGAKVKQPVQLARRFSEPADSKIEQLYGRLLRSSRGSGLRQGQAKLLDVQASTGTRLAGVVAVEWISGPGRLDFVLVNLERERRLGVVLPSVYVEKNWRVEWLPVGFQPQAIAVEPDSPGLKLDLPGLSGGILRVRMPA